MLFNLILLHLNLARGAIAKERIILAGNGKVHLKLKNPYSDGTTHYEFTPEQFIKRIISLIPPPRQNFIRYFGVFGARHRNRGEITSKSSAKKTKSKTIKMVYRTTWADLLKRVFKYEVIYCDNCNEKLKLIATITSPVICKNILDHLNLDSEKVIVKSPRGPPIYDEKYLPDDIIFNQESSWQSYRCRILS